jgi:hypothetical protein
LMNLCVKKTWSNRVDSFGRRDGSEF